MQNNAFFESFFNSRRQPLNGFLGALLFKIRFTFWSRFLFYIDYDYYAWLLYHLSLFQLNRC